MHILTIDLEEWFHCDLITGTGKWDSYERRLEAGTDRILEGLAARGQRATFFCLGWCVRRFPEVIRKIHAAGHGLGCHSDMHEMVFCMDPAAFREDTRRALGALADVTGEHVRAYRAPAFSITQDARWAFEILIEEGIEVDCSVFPARRDYGGFPSFGVARPVRLNVGGHTLKEFPINLLRAGPVNLVYSGGGYFRLFPYALIRHWTRRADYVMAYFHPRDFDARQPVLKHLPLHRRFKSYYGLSGAFPKFLRWMDDFAFISLEEAEAQVDWEGAGEVSV
ncbi:MAG: polysaccharide deacetylase family protein [Opitutales bacterium]|nr:polysaccharide deacetylase family protein [Opitutales bacterium]